VTSSTLTPQRLVWRFGGVVAKTLYKTSIFDSVNAGMMFESRLLQLNKEGEMDNKYEQLFSLNPVNFNSVASKLTADQLDYQVLLGFLESVDSDVRNGARLLLDKFSADQLDYQVLLGFLESGDSCVRNSARLLLDKFSVVEEKRVEEVLALFK